MFENSGDMFDEYDDNNDNNENIISYIDACHNIARAQKLNSAKLDTIVIDSASTIDVIGDKTILHDIHDAPSPLKEKNDWWTNFYQETVIYGGLPTTSMVSSSWRGQYSVPE